MQRNLGRGLEALLGGRDRGSMAELLEDSPADAKREHELQQIPVEQIVPGKNQPRQDMRAQALEGLAQSIHRQGVMQPVVVRKTDDGQFELIAGERRWRACQMSGVKTIPAIIKSVSERDALSMALIENIQREDLNPLEQAVALQRLQQEFDLTQQDVANAVGKSRVAVANLLRLLGLEPETRVMLERGELEMGHARALLAIDGPRQVELARQVARKSLSVRQTEELVRHELASEERGEAEDPPRRDPDLLRLEENLMEKLGARVAIQHTAKGKGRLVINYGSVAELEGILAHIN